MKVMNFGKMKKEIHVNKRLITLARRGMIRLPLKQGKLKNFIPIKATGKPASDIIIKERR